MMPAQTLDGEEWFDYLVKRYSDEFTEKGEASAVAKSKAIKKAIDEWNAVQLVTDMVPVESDTPSLIENAQKNGAKT